MYTRETRPLTDKEKRSLHRGIEAARKRIGATRKRAFMAGPAIIAALWGLTLLTAGKSAVMAASLFWLLIGIPICIASGAEAIRPHRRQIAKSEDALAYGRAEEVRITAEAMVELAEVEDEGACFAFQVEPELIVLVCGQDFYAGPRFPSTDFSIISIQGKDGGLADLLIDSRGEKLRPSRTITPDERKHLRSPEHLETISGKLNDLEEIMKEHPTSKRTVP